jgi:flavin-dependent dehydrogenase
MDEALWRLDKQFGVEMIEGSTVRQVRRLADGSGWEVEDDRQEVRHARLLILACGRWWRIDGLRSPGRGNPGANYGPWVGVKAHFRGISERDAIEMYFFQGGYCGLAPVEGGRYNACCLVHRSLLQAGHLNGGTKAFTDLARWLRVVAQHPALEARLRGAQQVSPTLATAPLRPARGPAEREGVLLAGDAAGFLDPFTGDGISMALHAGRLAASVVADRAVAEGLGGSPADVTRRYACLLSRAAGRSYTVAALIRTLVRAPTEVQDLAAKMVPWLGTHLLHATRWRDP